MSNRAGGRGSTTAWVTVRGIGRTSARRGIRSDTTGPEMAYELNNTHRSNTYADDGKAGAGDGIFEVFLGNPPVVAQ